jgi:hypothetical protein
VIKKLGLKGVVVGVACVTTLSIAPTAVWAAHTFEDVPETPAEQHAAVDWLASTGITKGCNDAQTLFCPGQAVTRGQMALFLERLSGTGDVPPSVNAATVGGKTAEELQGAPGPAGARGSTGPRGPSNGFHTEDTFSVPIAANDGTSTLAVQTIPGDGMFLTTAKVSFWNDSEGGRLDVFCTLGTNEPEEDQDFAAVSVPGGGYATVTLLNDYDTTGEGAHDVGLDCAVQDPNPSEDPDAPTRTVETGGAAISTIQVGSLAVDSDDDEPPVLTRQEFAAAP